MYCVSKALIKVYEIFVCLLWVYSGLLKDSECLVVGIAGVVVVVIVVVYLSFCVLIIIVRRSGIFLIR